MKQYQDLLQYILDNGIEKEDRTGTGTISIFGYQARYDLQKGFPLLTTKDLSGKRWDGIVHELLWFIKGDTDIKFLVNNGVNIWTPDAYRDYKSKTDNPMSFKDFKEHVKDHGYNLGPVYGSQWRKWVSKKGEMFDQLSDAISLLKKDPDSRRILVSAWNPGDMKDMTLPPCHITFQLYKRGEYLDCQLYQRSGDVFLGVSYNVASYSLLMSMIAAQVGLEPGFFIHTLGDAHLYKNHIDAAKLQLSRAPKKLPSLHLLPAESIFDYTADHVVLSGYESHPAIKADLSVGD